MGTVAIQTTLTNQDGTTLVDLLDDKVDAIRAIVQTYIPGLGKVIKGIMPPGDEAIPLPCVMVAARLINAKMLTTAKYDTRFNIDFVFYVGDDNPEAAAMKGTNAAMILRKLFSNNALTDIASPEAGYGSRPYGTDAYGDPFPTAETNSFRQYMPYWVDSEMSRVEISPLFKFMIDGQSKYVTAGFFQLTAQTFEIIQVS